MSTALIEELSRELAGVGLLRLNYSGESVNHPRFDDALRSLSATGARTELVSALASIPASHLHALVDCGLDRLSISLHTLDAGQFDEIYRFSSLANLKEKITALREYQRDVGKAKPEIDFAFVAMQRNLGQLQPLAAYAQETGATRIAVHPVIQRDPSDVDVAWELAGPQQLRPAFAQNLESTVSEAARRFPQIAIEVSRSLFPAVPQPAGLFTCEQNPFETTHILADGLVVPCEVLDRRVLGDLKSESWQSVWNGEEYRQFRSDYSACRIAECNRCEFRKPVTAMGPLLPLYGWHDRDAEGVLWSRKRAEARIEPGDDRLLRLKGVLPPGPAGTNRLEISQGGEVIGAAENGGPGHAPFQLDVHGGGIQNLVFAVEHTYCPAANGESTDIRDLGFALTAAEWCKTASPQPPGAPRLSQPNSWASWLLRGLEFSDAQFRGRRQARAEDGATGDPGVSVVIPARGSVEPLIECLESLEAARRAVHEPFQTIVVASGEGLDAYRRLQHRFEWVEFQFTRRPLGFSRAVHKGLRTARHPWVYLLNSDMVVSPGAIAGLLPQRAPDVFGISSRILMTGTERPESGLTRLRASFGRVEIFDQPTDGANGVEEHAYCGGGASLFRSDLLRGLVRASTCYDPFYWEDVEWGVSARNLGLRNLFQPNSTVQHRRRTTVGQFYRPEEVERIFERNRLLFQLRCFPAPAPSGALRCALESAAAQTRRELLRPAVLAGIVRQRRFLLGSPQGGCAEPILG